MQFVAHFTIFDHRHIFIYSYVCYHISFHLYFKAILLSIFLWINHVKLCHIWRWKIFKQQHFWMAAKSNITVGLPIHSDNITEIIKPWEYIKAQVTLANFSLWLSFRVVMRLWVASNLIRACSSTRWCSKMNTQRHGQRDTKAGPKVQSWWMQKWVILTWDGNSEGEPEPIKHVLCWKSFYSLIGFNMTSVESMILSMK